MNCQREGSLPVGRAKGKNGRPWSSWRSRWLVTRTGMPHRWLWRHPVPPLPGLVYSGKDAWVGRGSTESGGCSAERHGSCAKRPPIAPSALSYPPHLTLLIRSIPVSLRSGIRSRTGPRSHRVAYGACHASRNGPPDGISSVGPSSKRAKKKEL